MERVELARLNRITGMIVDAAVTVYSALGPGLLESAYQACLRHELRKRGLRVESEVPLPVVYDSVHLELGIALICWLRMLSCLNSRHAKLSHPFIGSSF